MSASGDDRGVLEVLAANGLLSVVRADTELRIVSCRGEAVAGIEIGQMLCDAVPALFGLEEQILSLKRFAGRRVEMTNMSVVERDGATARQDFVVLCDHAAGDFLLSITPSLANNALAVNLEQNLRSRYMLEAKVAAQARAIDVANKALQRTNEDLVNFTRMISHDLKAPMRAIRYSAEDIGDALSQSEDPDQARAVNQLLTQSKRLSRMVSDLLSYSRLEDKQDAAASVDTRQLVREIASSLPRPENIQLEIRGEWPQVTTTGVLLDIVLRNLLDNAIKHHDQDVGEIELMAERVDNCLVIAVSDDGPGIPEKYRQAVLRPFAKVDSQRPDASGMGLSMVHKMVQEVGGKLDVGDRLDGRRGTRITVSWPVQPS
jgi:signal transduction histidine kinase